MKRISEIDGLRGIAAVCVMLFHYTFAFNSGWSPGYFFHYGYMGVPLFFIISGFVISMSISDGKSVFDFCYGRFIRLFPIYWVSILITVVAMFLTGIGTEKLTAVNILVNLTMFQRFLGFEDIDGAYWTLAVELIFYFFLIIIIYFKKVDRIIEYFVTLILIIFIVRIFSNYVVPNNIQVVKIIKQFSYLHLFLAGIVFNKIYNSKFRLKDGFILLFCLLCNFGINLRFDIFIETIVVFLMMIMFLVLTSRSNKLFFLNFPIFQFLGKISYPLYLLNESFGAAIFRSLNLYFNMLLPIQIVVVSSIVIMTASVVHFFIEIPVFRLLKQKKKETPSLGFSSIVK